MHAPLTAAISADSATTEEICYVGATCAEPNADYVVICDVFLLRL